MNMNKILLMAVMMFTGVTVHAQSVQADVPLPVASAFNQKFPAVNFKDVDWDSQANIYKAEFSKEGKDYEVYFNSKGEWISTRMDNLKAEELPMEIKAAISKSEYSRMELGDADVKQRPGETIYKVEIEEGLIEKKVYINQDGEVVDKARFNLEEARYGKKRKNKSES